MLVYPGGDVRHLSAAALRQRGLTLIEVMVALAIAAVLAMSAAPFLGDYAANARLREGGNALLAETLFAQSEALKRNATVRVVLNNANITLRDMSTGGTGTLIRTTALPAPVLAETNTSFNLGSDGRPTPFGTAVSINLKASGQTCSADRRCPGLRVDAGGAIRLCGDITRACP